MPLSSPGTVIGLHDGSTVANVEELRNTEDTEKVAKKFEALLIHNMLKAMRSTTLGEKPSNERAMYDDMFDQKLANVISESGRLGVARSISRELNAQAGVENSKSDLSFSNVERNMQALSNNPATLASNGRLPTDLANINQYRAQTNQLTRTYTQALNHNYQTNNNVINAVEDTNHTSLIETKREFINDLMPDARRNANRLGVQPDIIIAIAALETGWGKHVIKSENGVSSHNLFGIKAHERTTPHTIHKTTEYIDNNPVKVDAAFRQYENSSSAVDDFADFLLSNPRYQNALEAHSDNQAFLRELQRAGYATDPEYANKAIDVLQQIKSIRQGSAL